MRTTTSICLLIASLALGATAVAQKRGAGIDLFAPGKNAVAPGLHAALMLTDEQKQQMAAARKEIMESEAVAAARRTAKDQNASDDQRQAARQALQDAEARLRERTAAILTAEQKQLIERLNAAYAEVQRPIQAEYQDRLAAAKANNNKDEIGKLHQEMIERMRTEFARRLETLLTPAQLEAVKRAAAAEPGK